MPYYRGVAQDEQGNAISGASVTVYDEGTTTEATIYSDATRSTAQTQPITTGSDGEYAFWIAPGIYDVEVAADGFTTITHTDVQVGPLMAAAQCTTGGSDSIPVASLVDTPGTWADLIECPGAWSHTGAKFTWLGDETVWVRYHMSGSFNIDVGTFHAAGATIDGSYVSGQNPNRNHTTGSTYDPLALTGIVQMAKDEVLGVGWQETSGAGSGTLTINGETIMTVEVVG